MPQNITKIALISGQTRTITNCYSALLKQKSNTSVILPHVHKYQEI